MDVLKVFEPLASFKLLYEIVFKIDDLESFDRPKRSKTDLCLWSCGPKNDSGELS